MQRGKKKWDEEMRKGRVERTEVRSKVERSRKREYRKRETEVS